MLSFMYKCPFWGGIFTQKNDVIGWFQQWKVWFPSAHTNQYYGDISCRLIPWLHPNKRLLQFLLRMLIKILSKPIDCVYEAFLPSQVFMNFADVWYDNNNIIVSSHFWNIAAEQWFSCITMNEPGQVLYHMPGIQSLCYRSHDSRCTIDKLM